MCGLVGFLRRGGLQPGDQQLVENLAARLIHRGPDDQGVWLDAQAGVAFGHRRLAVIDLSAAGHQPMLSASGRYVISFNGEIYNHLELRDQLSAADASMSWRGHSDTETMLAAFERWGIEQTLVRSVGMFAFALWDRRERTLTLARDRLGEKPLYYGWQGDVFLFGSELKALTAHPSFVRDIDRRSLALYMRYGYIPAPSSIYRGVFKLSPGSVVQLDPSRPLPIPEPRSYWSLQQAVERGAAHPYRGGDADAVLELESHLRSAVALQGIADVPLGAFLSGGVDSSTVVALMQAGATRAVKTYTVGYQESSYSEAPYALAVAQHLGTQHAELQVTGREALEVVPRLTRMYDEPFGDSSAIPAFLISSFARQHVTVALSGDGGDELFGGYTRYQRTTDIWRVMRRIPYPLRTSAAGAIRVWRRAGESAARLASYLSATTLEECYEAQISHYAGASGMVLGEVASGRRAAPSPFVGGGENFDRMMYADSAQYLPDDILTKVDRASMAVSLEVRVPMLDHRVLEFAWRLPARMKVREREGKWLLKQLLKKYLPASLIDRPKQGFGVPVGQWLKGPLRDWAENLLSESQLRSQGFLNPAMVRRRWARHLGAERGEDDGLWQILAFQAWIAHAA